MNTKSHEYISKVILRGFSYGRKGQRYVNYVRLPNGKIGHDNIKTFNTRSGAYTDKNEEIMNAEFETFLGDLKAKIDKVAKKGGEFQRDDFDIDKIKKYFAYQFIRDDVSVDNLYNLSTFLSSGITSHLGKNKIDELKNELLSDEPSSHFLLDLLKSDKLIVKYDNDGGLLGTNFPVNVSTKDAKDAIGLSLSSKVFLVLVSDFSSNIMLNYLEKGFDDVTNKPDVEFFNKRMIQTGCSRGWGIVISNDRERLKKYLSKKVV